MAVSFVLSHSEVLKNVCRICSAKFKKNSRVYNVADYCNDIEKAFRLVLSEDKKDLHPTKFCEVCRNAMKNILKKQITHTNTVPIFTDHTDGCLTCERYVKMSTGGRPVKRKSSGRPKFNSSIWTRILSDNLYADTEDIIPGSISFATLKNDNESMIEFVICKMCDGVLKRPLLLPCHHSFCFGCLAAEHEGNATINCVVCATECLPSMLVPNREKMAMLSKLCVLCCCGEKILVGDKTRHEKNCKGPKKDVSLSDMTNLQLDTPIPKEIERAALTVVRHKLKNSENNTIEFCSGGPRVGIL